MNNYTVTFQKICLTQQNAKPHGNYNFEVEAEDIFLAARNAVPTLRQVGFNSDVHDVWNATITDSTARRQYEILREGAWLVDFKTGKQLERRVEANK